MLSIETKTKLTPEQFIVKAISFFGPDGLKLKITSRADTSVSFEKDEGSITVVATREKTKLLWILLPGSGNHKSNNSS